MQTNGNLFNFHSHVHELVLLGLVREERFHDLKKCYTIAVAKHCLTKFLTTLINQEVLISDEV